MTISAQYWPYLMAVLYLVGALLSAGAGLWIARFGDRERPDRVALLAACTAMTVWCAATITLPPDHAGTELALTARNLALIMLIFRLFVSLFVSSLLQAAQWQLRRVFGIKEARRF